MAARFKGFLHEGMRHYFRFVDNIVILHQDKTFLHIMTEISVMVLSRDYHIVINNDYNVRPTWMGIRLCGYQFYHEHTLSSKSNKQNTARRIRKLQKKGLTEEQIRINCASRLGYIKHADCISLLKKLGMKNSIGKIIRRHRIKPPFEGLSEEDKIKFLNICKMLNETNSGVWDKRILLLDYKVEDSKIEKTTVTVEVPDSEGRHQTVTKTVPDKVLALRFKKIMRSWITTEEGEETEHYEFEKRKDKEGNPTLLDWEHYSFTGSKILIDQALNDFSHEDLPAPTIIEQFKGKNGNTFFKFT